MPNDCKKILIFCSLLMSASPLLAQAIAVIKNGEAATSPKNKKSKKAAPVLGEVRDAAFYSRELLQAQQLVAAKDYKAAYGRFKGIASSNRYAAYNLAYMEFCGFGVPVDCYQSASWYETAINIPRALPQDPSDLEARQALAWTLAMCPISADLPKQQKTNSNMMLTGRTKQLERAMGLVLGIPKNLSAHFDGVALVFAAKGDFSAAVGAQTNALNLARANLKHGINVSAIDLPSIQLRLAAYKAQDFSQVQQAHRVAMCGVDNQTTSSVPSSSTR